MKLKEIYSQGKKPVISYEVFPPKDDADGEKLENLFEELNKLMVFNPSLISVTYGAGGSNRNESIEIIRRIKQELKIPPMPHFTCVSTSTKNISEYLKTIESFEVKNILALRGDVPKEGNVCHDFKHADELVQYIKSNTDLSVAVAGYPEGHKECESFEKDLFYLKQKTGKGADVIYTQMFFNNEHYFSFVEKCSKIGITQPVIPGILPVSSYNQLLKMADMCKVEIPQKMKTVLEKYQEDKDYTKKYAIEYAAQQCSELLQNGVKGLHFYTLNKAYAVSEILKYL